jgi:hypothetical protein
MAFGMLMTTTVLAKDELPEVDSDGLHLVKDSKVRVAYLKPGADLGQYSKVMLVDCFVQFKKNWAKDYNLEQIGLQGRVTDKKTDEIKAALAAEFKKIFTDTLTKDGHVVVDTAGPDVLLLRPAIINLDVAAPDVMRASMGNTWVSSAGEMTLYMELYDSASSVIIGRVVDPQADRGMNSRMANSVTNKAAADRIIQSWATLLSKHLTEVRNGG